MIIPGAYTNMAKHFIRTLWNAGHRPLWSNQIQKSALQDHLNELGFYVLDGPGDSLDVYVTSEYEPADIRAAKKVLDNIKKVFNTYFTK